MLGALLDTWNAWLGLVCSFGFCLGFLIAAVRWVHHRTIKSIEDSIRPAIAAVTPNGGSSMADAVKRIEEELRRQGGELDGLTISVKEHLAYHKGVDAARSAH